MAGGAAREAGAKAEAGPGAAVAPGCSDEVVGVGEARRAPKVLAAPEAAAGAKGEATVGVKLKGVAGALLEALKLKLEPLGGKLKLELDAGALAAAVRAAAGAAAADTKGLAADGLA